jgi:hypothetical protein
MPRLLLPICALFVLVVAASLLASDTVSSSWVKRRFADPPRDYAVAPLWVWNDQLTDEQVLGTLRDLAAQKVKQAIVHPRPGLMTPYLSAEWFRLWKLALKEAGRLDMNLWIYDENSYPSGFAGGFVPEAMPESRGRGLRLQPSAEPPQWSDELIAIYSLSDTGYEDVSRQIRVGSKLPRGSYLAASIARAQPGPWYGGKSYVDLLYPGVTQKFLEITLDAYRKMVGSEFGRRVPGVFSDEPHVRPAGNLPWTDDLPRQFEKRWGYSLLEHLPALQSPVGDWKKVRHNYFQTLLDLFIERWARPYYEYCERNKLEFSGHYWEHEWPNCLGVPDNMAMSAWQQRPGIDILMNQYAEDTHAQFGNVRAVKEISSLANQLGYARTLCEAYGAGGWDLRFVDMKRIGDWMYALGVNTLDPHLSYVSIRGARKRDHPQSFSYHEPWWNAYEASASYFARLSLALSQGEQIHQILLLEPTTSAWMLNSATGNPSELAKLGDSFQKLVVDLEKAQVEYDLGCEDVLARHASIDGKALRVGHRSYQTVILPPMTENLNAKTADLLERYLKAGGSLISCSVPPERIDGSLSPRGQAIASLAGWRKVEPESLPALLLRENKDGFAITRAAGSGGILYHHRRQLQDGELLFLVNTSMNAPVSGSVEAAAGGVEEWDPQSGVIRAVPFEPNGGRIRTSFELLPAGSRLLFLTREKRKSPRPAAHEFAAVAPAGPVAIERIAPNVLLLDYMDIRAGGEARTDTYFYQASQFAFQRNGARSDPWDSAVQFRDELINLKFAPDSGVEATYRFAIEDRMPQTLTLVVERSDLYTILCNGKPVSAVRDQWWLDRSFGKIDIATCARIGANEVVLKAAPFTIYHELEPVYLLGDFGLRPADRGFVIVPEMPGALGPWNQQGMPFYAEGMVYKTSFQIQKPAGDYFVRLPQWYGSVARIKVNDRDAGVIYAPPWQLEISKHMKAGTNEIAVTVIGTLKNTLGPHHGNPALGTAWPGMFQKAPNPGPPPGSQYSTVGYGLFQPFELWHSVR